MGSEMSLKSALLTERTVETELDAFVRIFVFENSIETHTEKETKKKDNLEGV